MQAVLMYISTACMNLYWIWYYLLTVICIKKPLQITDLCCAFTVCILQVWHTVDSAWTNKKRIILPISVSLFNSSVNSFCSNHMPHYLQKNYNHATSTHILKKYSNIIKNKMHYVQFIFCDGIFPPFNTTLFLWKHQLSLEFFLENQI